VPVSEPAGTGGRNQHFALYAAQLIDGMANTAVLSAGSDGLDGNSPAAGAVADSDTWEHATDPAGALERFDSGTVFAAMGDAIVTGPTGNNLRDLRVLLAED
jgi:hydroxypyruvate reductase